MDGWIFSFLCPGHQKIPGFLGEGAKKYALSRCGKRKKKEEGEETEKGGERDGEGEGNRRRRRRKRKQGGRGEENRRVLQQRTLL